MPKPVQASSYTFRDIINGGFLDVDKTRTIYKIWRRHSAFAIRSKASTR